MKKINPARRIALGFALVILVGALLLMLPISSRSREVTPFMTSLFTSTSATCVTGLTLANTGAHFSLFGQAVIITLIQLGGLGFMTILCFAFIVSSKHIGLQSRMMLAQSMGLDNVGGVVRLAKHVFMITAAVEGAGAAVLAVRFIPTYGLFKGLWYSVFHSVSAFCNAGFDIIGDGNSVLSYKHDPLVLITLALLIIIGGVGFIVWEDVRNKRSWKKLTPYSKIIMITTIILLVAGTAIYFVLEYNNPDTMGNDSVGEKFMLSFFQSVTTRTAGFDSIVQDKLTPLSKVWGIILMMIGGASGSTAGGVKVGTIALIIIALFAVLRAKSEVVVYGRSVSVKTIMHAMALLILWLVLTIVGASLISYFDNQTMLNSMYEVASAYSTVGLTVGVSETASLFTKMLLIVYMFFGRVGIMTISVVFIQNSARTVDIKYPEGKFLIG